MMTKLIGLVTISIVLPSTIIITNDAAWAGEVKVNTPNIEAVTRSDGSIYLNSGGTTVRVPSRRRYWTPWHSWRLPWQNYSSTRPKCHHSSYQSTSQVTASGNKIVQSSISSQLCN